MYNISNYVIDYINFFIYYKKNILEKHPDNILLKYCIDKYKKI